MTSDCPNIGQTPQRYKSWGKLSIWISRKAMKRVDFSLGVGGCNERDHTIKN
jgi:hypothetical protein